jgi:universal stress protein E
MERFKNILTIVSSDSDLNINRAVERGSELSQQNSGHLTLMDIINTPHSNIREYGDIIKADEIIDMLVIERQKELELIAEKIRESGVDVSTKVVMGRDFIEIVQQVIHGKHDLLIKEANRHTGSFDSCDFHLMRKCPQPVWLIKPYSDAQCRTVLATIDLTLENDAQGRVFNTQIMDMATSLASLHDSDLHILSCWSLYGESTLRNSGFMKVSDERLEEMLQQEEQANRTILYGLTDRYPYPRRTIHLFKGEPKSCIPEFVETNHIDVVVMGSVARSGIPGLLIGNTAETVLQLIDSSVITLKPDGFESPIK